MKVVSLLLALALLVSATIASKVWIVVPGLSIEESQSLIFSYDVRVIQPDMALLLGTADTYAALLKPYPATLLAGPFDPERSYLIVERPEFANATPQDMATWAVDTLQAINDAGFDIVYSAPLRFIVSAPGKLTAAHYDGFPPETEFVTVLTQAIIPVPAKAASALNKKVTFRDDIADLIAQVDSNSLLDFDYYLSGDSPDSNLTTRNSFSDDVYDAANWIQDHFEASGFTVTQEPFQSTYGPNVIATLRGTTNPNTYVIVGGHYDSRSANSGSGTARAPGANDDGSGTSALLEIARLIGLNKIRFRYSVILGAWCGEEQGLVGSRAYAKNARNRNVDILAMLQGDMLAYRIPGERLQVAFPDRYHTPALTSQVKDIINTYVPEIDACDTSACCSDQQSFYEQGYAATFFFERCGPLSDNQYHREGDVVDRVGFDVEQWTLITKSLFASLLTLAEAI